MLVQLEAAVYLFLCLLKCFIITTIVLAWVPMLQGVRDVLLKFLEPLFHIIRYLLKHSIYHTSQYDMTPLIALLIVSFFQTIFSNA